jgi:hypothetical protein
VEHGICWACGLCCTVAAPEIREVLCVCQALASDTEMTGLEDVGALLQLSFHVFDHS